MHRFSPLIQLYPKVVIAGSHSSERQSINFLIGNIIFANYSANSGVGKDYSLIELET